MRGIEQLPEVIYQEIQSYLLRDDYYYFIISSSILQEVKRKTVYYPLNFEYSLRYFNDEDFRETLLAQTSDPSKQIMLHFYFPNQKQRNSLLSAFFSLAVSELRFHRIICKFKITHTAHLQRLQHISVMERLSLGASITAFPALPRLRDLCLAQGERITDVSQLRHLHILTLCDCPQLSDITPLRDIPDLQLIACPDVTDFSCLGGQVKLHIGHCEGLTEVSNLSSVKHLSLESCDNLHDVRALKEVYDVEIIDCGEVAVRQLQGVHHRLSVRGCQWPMIDSDYLFLRGVSDVTLEDCPIRDIEVLSEAAIVRLSNCYHITDVSPLSRAKSVSLENLSKVTDLTSLSEVVDLSLGGVDVNDVTLPVLQSRHSLTFSGVKKLTSLLSRHSEDLCKIHALTIDSCTDLKALTHHALATIPHVSVSECPSLTDISGLGRNRSVRIKSCQKLRDVRALSDVAEVTINDCPVTDYSPLRHVPRLKILHSVQRTWRRCG